jgi:dUTP pyrophosphatase
MDSIAELVNKFADRPRIGLVKNHPDAQLPTVNNKHISTGDTGYDLYSVESSYIPPNEARCIDVGLTLAFVEPGYWFQIMPRSGLGFTKGLQPHLGVIDNQYRGDLAVKLYNFSDKPTSLAKGDRIAQIVIHKLHQAEFQFVNEISPTDRGTKGIGSSGK